MQLLFWIERLTALIVAANAGLNETLSRPKSHDGPCESPTACIGTIFPVISVGVITSPNYPDSPECACFSGFTLFTFDRTEVAITFDEFHLHNESGDYVEIHCGIFRNAIFMKKCMGQFCPQISCGGTGKWKMSVDYYISPSSDPAYFKATFYKHNLAPSFPPHLSTSTTAPPSSRVTTTAASPTTEAHDQCVDKLEACSMEICAAEPGMFLCKCRKTCNYCSVLGTEGCLDNPGVPCAIMRKDCYRQSIRNICPRTCDSCPICSADD